VFVSSHIEVKKDEYLDRVNITKFSIYENPEDNIKYPMGYIRFDNDIELDEIIEGLERLQ